MSKKNITIVNILNSYDNYYNKFINSDENNIIESIDNIKKIITQIDKKNIKLLINEINNKINKYSNDQNIYLSLKSFNICCNKYLFKNNFIKRINNILNAMKNTDNIKRIIFYIKKISYYIENNNIKINYLEIINILEDILYNNKIIKDNNTEYILILINKCKKINNIIYNDLENILLKIDNNIYDYIYFLRNKILFNEKENIISFLLTLNYLKKDMVDIDKLNLKRGFVQGLKKNNKYYLLKYQPNKSVLELIINTYIKLLNKKNFLVPLLFIINSDNSYFYIIEKFDTDLNKYFNILSNNNKILPLSKIIEISILLIKSISELHKNNIIHCDIKLENIVVNIDENHNINDLRIIDFDVSLFNIIPKELENIPEKYKKILNNKKQRGTRIYMLKSECMDFKNDIYSLGVLLLIILYKNIKLLISQKKYIKTETLKYNNNILKELNKLRDNIEDNSKKIEMLELLENYIKKNKNNLTNFLDVNYNKFKYFKELIINCINTKLNINEIENKYFNIF